MKTEYITTGTCRLCKSTFPVDDPSRTKCLNTPTHGLLVSSYRLINDIVEVLTPGQPFLPKPCISCGGRVVKPAPSTSYNAEDLSVKASLNSYRLGFKTPLLCIRCSAHKLWKVRTTDYSVAPKPNPVARARASSGRQPARSSNSLSSAECKEMLGICQGPSLYISRDHLELAKRVLAYGESKPDCGRSFPKATWALLSTHPQLQHD